MGLGLPSKVFHPETFAPFLSLLVSKAEFSSPLSPV